jgi:hypothetical protein
MSQYNGVEAKKSILNYKVLKCDMFKIPLVNIVNEIYLKPFQIKKMEAQWKKRNSRPLYPQILI